MGFRTVGFVAVAALVATPILAEKAFIPAADGATAGGATHRTEISLANAKGARAATVLAKIGYEAGGASTQQKVALGGGQSLRLSGLAGNGLVELDLAKGVKATATLVVERADGKIVRASLPVLTQADNMPAGSKASLKNLSLPEDYRKFAVGAVNLSSRAMRCEARFEGPDGELLAAPIGFTVAPFAERRAGSFAGGKGRVDIDTLNTLRCDQPFWTYALAEQPKTGDVKVVYPEKEVQLTAMASASPETTLSYSIPGVFLVPSPAKWTYRYNMYFSFRAIKQVFTEFTVYHGGWDPEKPDGNHMLIQLQKEGWNTLMQYMLTKKSWVNKFYWHFIDVSKGAVKSYNGLLPGRTYVINTWWDSVNLKNGFRIEKNGVLTVTKQGALNAKTINTNKLNIRFANGNNLPFEPDSRSPGWKWSDFKIDIIN